VTSTSTFIRVVNIISQQSRADGARRGFWPHAAPHVSGCQQTKAGIGSPKIGWRLINARQIALDGSSNIHRLA
jgi:hypothetical protein